MEWMFLVIVMNPLSQCTMKWPNFQTWSHFTDLNNKDPNSFWHHLFSTLIKLYKKISQLSGKKLSTGILFCRDHNKIQTVDWFNAKDKTVGDPKSIGVRQCYKNFMHEHPQIVKWVMKNIEAMKSRKLFTAGETSLTILVTRPGLHQVLDKKCTFNEIRSY